jgi:phospholipase C
MNGYLDPIDHVVVLMLENRSLDNVLGWLYPDSRPSYVIGDDSTPDYNGLQLAPHSNQYRDRTIWVTQGTRGRTGHVSVPAQPLRVPGSDPNEWYENVNQQLFGSSTNPTKSNPQKGTRAEMAGFAYDYDAAWESWEQLDQIMEAYSPAQLPILNGLAGAYAVSDAWHSSVPTQTNPNRAFSLCGTSLGRTDNLRLDALEQFQTKTIWNALPSDTTWGIYYHDIWYAGQCYTQYTFPQCNQALASGEVETIQTFYDKAKSGKLPRFSYLEPQWGYGLGKHDGSGFYCGKFAGKIIGAQGNDYHPPTWVGPGEAFVNQVYSALTANRDAWFRTLLVITFDEHGGTYDHVDPGWDAVQPDGHFGPDGFAFNRLGLRVPTLLISPWIPSRTVFRSSKPGLKYDHTSLISTLLRWRGVDPVNAGLGDRVKTAPTFEGVLAKRARPDIPTFNLPPGYADQGKECRNTDSNEQAVPVGVARSLVAGARTLDEVQLRQGEWLLRNKR